MPSVPHHPSQAGSGNRLSEAVSRLNDCIQAINRNIEFTVKEDVNRVIVKVYNRETAEVVREIPAEEVLDLSDHPAMRTDWVRKLGF